MSGRAPGVRAAGMLLLAAAGLAAWWAARAPAPAAEPAAPAVPVRALPLPVAAHVLPAVPQRQPPAVAVALPVGPAYGRHGRAVDLGGLTVAQFIDRHAPAARRGDPQAVQALYEALAVCATRDDPLPDVAAPADRDALLREQAQVRRLCAGVSPAQVQERLRFLAAAADAGLAQAQVDFYAEGPDGAGVSATLQADSADDPALAAWRAQAVAHLQRAAAQCEPFAMGLLASLYDGSLVAPASPALAVTYAAAEGVARGQPRSAARLQGAFGAGLTPAEVDAARRDGEQLARQACTR